LCRARLLGREADVTTTGADEGIRRFTQTMALRRITGLAAGKSARLLFRLSRTRARLSNPVDVAHLSARLKVLLKRHFTRQTD
jgi:hypothetical protein